MASPGENLFDEFTKGGSARVERLVADAEPESEFLDFKLRSSTAPGASGDDRRNLGKALSGFSNADGGVIVWGIDGRKNAQGVDVAVGYKPFADHVRFLTDLRSLTGSLVEPLNAGVRHQNVPTAGGNGYVVSYVPGSDLTPHRSLADGLYYIRTGDGFHKMTHVMLQDSFGSRRRPKLNVYAQATGRGVLVRVVNDGRHSAMQPAVRLRVAGGEQLKLSNYGVDGNYRWALERLPSAGTHVAKEGYWFGGGPKSLMLHPGMTVDVAMFEFHDVSKNWAGADVLRLKADAIATSIEYEAFAEGMEPIDGVMDVTFGQILGELYPGR